MTYHTFAAANTQSGFYSLFSEFTQHTDQTLYLIKGGPGTGKSTFMKRIAAAAAQKGYQTEQIHCSSDADSLDGVCVPECKLTVLDATAPHCVDPQYPGVVESILPFGQFWDASALSPHKAQIIALSDEISAHFQKIYQYLAAAGSVRHAMNQYLESALSPAAVLEQADKILRRLAVLPLKQPSETKRRFVSAVTKDGPLVFEDLLQRQHTVVIEDSYDASYLYMRLVDSMLEDMGQTRLLLLNPLCPQHIDHIILPEHSLAFITKNARCPVTLTASLKTVSMKSVLDKAYLSEVKNKLSFGKKMCASLYGEVQQLLTNEKALHDELEQYYINAMDFDAVLKAADDCIAAHL